MPQEQAGLNDDLLSAATVRACETAGRWLLSRLCSPAGAADLKFLHPLPLALLRNFKSISGTRTNMLASALLVFEVRVGRCGAV
jgi:hypothetical protein